VALGNAITPAILGSAMNSTYEKKLQDFLPAELSLHIDAATLESLADPRVLMSQDAMTGLRDAFNSIGDQEPNLFDRTVHAIRSSLQSGLKIPFLIGAITKLVSFLFIITIPEVSMDVEAQDKRPGR
jgi:hypothetical protein